MRRSKLIGLAAFLLSAGVLVPAVPSSAAPAPITGTVYRDYNHDGSRDVGEPGWPGVSITATDPSGAQLSSTSLADGTYSITGTDSETTYEVTFAFSESFLRSGRMGPDSGAVTQFVNGGQAANFSVVNPADYCDIPDAELGYATTCFVNGDPTAGSDYTESDTLVAIHGDADGAAGQAGADPAEPDHLGLNTVLGSTYGLAWQPTTQFFYTSATLKRHVGLGDGGIDAIYVVDTTAAAGTNASLFYTAIDAGDVDSAAVRGMPRDETAPVSLDTRAFGQIYKVGWGDIDISPDETLLYGVNLFDRSLYAINIEAAAGGSTTAHTNLGRPAHVCTGGVDRPFGIEVLDGEVWMAVTCTAELSDDPNDLSAAVYALDVATGQWAVAPAIDFPLNYTKGCLTFGSGCEFNPWIDVYSPANFNFTPNPASPYDIPLRGQPIVSDLEIDREGYLTIGIRDRQGDQFGHRNAAPDDITELLTGAGGGDILLASPNGDGTWTLESNGATGTRTSGAPAGGTISGPGGVDSNQGPGGGEFFWADFVTSGGAKNHSETSIGSLALAPGRLEIAATVTDPQTDALDAAGFSFFTNANGNKPHSYQLFQDGGDPQPAVLGKANALGDLEAMCPPAPLQIGNRVWLDANNDGIQNPGELPIAGVTITIADNDPGTPDVQVVTDADGLWSYTAAPLTAYVLTVDHLTADVSGLPGVAAAADLLATSSESGSDDYVDSDMSVVGQTINFTTSVAGSNNHSLDAGFVAAGLELGNLVWLDTNNNGVAEADETPIPGVTIQLWIDTTNDGTPDTQQAETVTDDEGHYNFAGLASGTYYVRVPDQSGSGMPLFGVTSSTPTTVSADNDVDNDDNGVDPSAADSAIWSGAVVLSDTTEPTEEVARYGSGNADDSPTALPDSDSNLSVDFGFYPLASLGNRVWYDEDMNGVQDPGELNVPNVVVKLLDQAGNVLQTTTTDENGRYLFENLPAGTYVVCFELDSLPTGYQVTATNAGADDAQDSDANASGKTGAVTLGPGDQNLTLDLGIYQPSAVGSGGLTPKGKLPVTGSDSTTSLALIGSILLALGASTLALRKRVL